MRVCNEKCWFARGQRCRCVCGGAWHNNDDLRQHLLKSLSGAGSGSREAGGAGDRVAVPGVGAGK